MNISYSDFLKMNMYQFESYKKGFERYKNEQDFYSLQLIPYNTAVMYADHYGAMWSKLHRPQKPPKFEDFNKKDIKKGSIEEYIDMKEKQKIAFINFGNK